MFEIFHKRTLKNGVGEKWPIPVLSFPAVFRGTGATAEQKTGVETGAGIEWGSKGKRAILRPGSVARGLPGCGAGSIHTQHTLEQASGAGRPGLGSASQLPPRPPTHSSWVSPAAMTVPALPGPSWGVRRLPKVV